MKVSGWLLTLPLAFPFLTQSQAAATPDESPVADNGIAEQIDEVVYEGVTYENTPDDREWMRMNRALYGVPSDDATIDALIDRYDGASVVYTNGSVFTAEEVEQVELQASYGQRAGDIIPELEKFDSFGGAWIDHENGGTVSIAVTVRGTDVEALASKSLVGVPLEFVVVDKSLDELLSVYEKLNELISDGTLEADIAVKESTNAIEITAPERSLDLARSAVGLVAGDVRVDYVVGGLAVNEVNLIGGAGIARTANGNNYCSLGPTLIRQSNGERVTTTAGHCDPYTPNRNWYRGSAYIGRTLDNTEIGPVDAALIRVDSGDYATDDVFIFDAFQNVARLKDVFGWSIPLVGDQICESQGDSIATRCGPVTDRIATGGGNTNQIRATLCSRPGDSGSVGFRDYANNVAIVGIHQAGTDNGFNCNSTDTVLLSKIGNVNSTFGTSVATS